MSITTSAGDGVRITSAAMNETLGSQTQQTGNNTVVVSDTFTNLNNGNVSGIGYVNRLCIIRQGTGTEETRLITADAAGTGTTRILTVHEDWTTVPASSDTIHVSYVIQDAATVTGLGLINKRNQDYSSTRKFRVGNTGGSPAFAYFALLFGASLETVDNSSTTDPDVRVENNGRFDSGYIANGSPVGGGEMYLTPAVNGELAFEGVSGCECNWYDSVMIAVARPAFNFLASTTSKVRMIKCVFKFPIADFRLGAQDSDLNDVVFASDDTGTTPRVQVRDWATGNEVKNIVFDTFNGLETVTSGDDPVIRNFKMISNSKLATIATGETWIWVNPIHPTITTANQNDVSIAGTGELLRKYEFRNYSHDLSDNPLTAKHYVMTLGVRGTAGANTVTNEDTADANGESIQDVEVERYIDSGGTALSLGTSSGFAEFSAEYGYIPIIKNITPANEDETTYPTKYGKAIDYAHSDDVYQVQSNAGTARTLGDTTNAVAFEKQKDLAQVAGIIIKYTSGSNTLSVGDTLGNSLNSATYTVKEIIEGDSTAGTIICASTGNFAISDSAQTLDNDPGTWTATYTVGSLKLFDWFINADGLTAQELYDYLNAKLDEGTLDTATPIFMDEMLAWAVGDVNALPFIGDVLDTSNKFKTVRNSSTSSGIAVYNLGGTGLGAITGYTSNDGTEFTPAATVTLTVHCERKDTGANISGVQILIKRVSDGSTVDSGTTNASGDFSVSFTYTSDVPVTIDARKSTLPIPRYFTDVAANTITSSGMTQNFLMREDTIVAQS